MREKRILRSACTDCGEHASELLAIRRSMALRIGTGFR